MSLLNWLRPRRDVRGSEIQNHMQSEDRTKHVRHPDAETTYGGEPAGTWYALWDAENISPAALPSTCLCRRPNLWLNLQRALLYQTTKLARDANSLRLKGSCFSWTFKHRCRCTRQQICSHNLLILQLSNIILSITEVEFKVLVCLERLIMAWGRFIWDESHLRAEK